MISLSGEASGCQVAKQTCFGMTKENLPLSDRFARYIPLLLMNSIMTHSFKIIAPGLSLLAAIAITTPSAQAASIGDNVNAHVNQFFATNDFGTTTAVVGSGV